LLKNKTMFGFFRKDKEEQKMLQHNGVFKKEITLFQAIALIVTSTLGAHQVSRSQSEQ